MSSFWPFRRDTNSPASFERTLSKLSARITAQTASLDRSRSSSRRIRALFTLYTTLAYLVYTLILALVLGHRRWNLGHYAGLLGAPAVIYAVRRAMEGVSGWRISRQENGLEELVKQREETIKQLKEATKYNSTQELIKKYGGDTPKEKKTGPPQGVKRKASSQQQQTPPGPRTGIAPPPTANIPGRNLPSPPPPYPNSPNTPLRASSSPQPQHAQQHQPSPSESFAPNAFASSSSTNPTYAPPPSSSSHWYDRLLDVLLGEDETLARNRLALICGNCRLVNGQAPPGARNLAEIGRWRCAGCGAMNGEESESEVRKVVREAKRRVELQQNQEEEGWEEIGGKGAAAEEEDAGEDFVDEKAGPALLREKMRKRTESERSKASRRSPANGIEEPEEDGDEDEGGDITEDLDEMHGEATPEEDGEGGEEEQEQEEPQKPVTRSAAKGKKGKGKR
ncbi:MAG: hypothetical protein Q9160_006106 [Pyrenula sp. 1 TL-2023]